MDLQDRADVVVIGGGVIGTSIACNLAEAGLDVLLLEAHDLASGSTSKAAGGVRASFSDPLNIAMGLRGLEVYADFPRRYGQQIDFSRRGYLYCLSDQSDVEAFTECADLQRHLGLHPRMLTPEQATAVSPVVDPASMVAALWSPDDARATPESVVAGYVKTARRLGASIATGVRVTAIERSGPDITAVVTTAGTVSTPRVVCAAGAWSAAVGQMVDVHLPVAPSRRVIAFTEPLYDRPQPWPLTVSFPSTFYFHPEGLGLAFGWSDSEEPDGFDLTVDLERWLERVAPHVAHAAPSLLSSGIARSWAGLYENTPDHNQIIGRSAEVPGFFYATGFSGHGFLMAPATGEIVRDLVLERAPRFDISGLDARRFDQACAQAERNII
jgi:sarcosine oxidase subunit beta